MHCFVVNVGTDTLRDVEPILFRFRSLSEMLLLITNVMLSASHHTSILHALNCGGDQSAGKVWIRRETFLLQSQALGWSLMGDSGLPNSCHLLVRDREGRTQDLTGHRLLCHYAPHPLPGHVRMQGFGSMSPQRSAQQGMRKHSRLPKRQNT